MRWHTYQSAWFHLEKLRKKLGISFTFHQARHSFATWLRRQKVDLRGVQLAGDWKNIKSVVRYQDVDVEEQRELISKRD